MGKKADFYINKILSNLNGEVQYYTGEVEVASQKVKGVAYSNLSKLSEKAKEKLFAKIEQVLEEKGLTYEIMERYKYDKESILTELAQEELNEYEEKMMNKYGDINSFESMDEYLSANNKKYAATIEGLEAIYGADSETFLQHKENAINHFKQELVEKVEAGREKILNKADKEFDKSVRKYLNFDKKREFVLRKLNEKVTSFDSFVKGKETKVLDDLKAEQEKQDLNKNAHDNRLKKLGELGNQAVDNSKAAYGKAKTKIGSIANSIKSKFTKENITKKIENKFLSKVKLRERLGKVKDKICNLGIKGNEFEIDANEIDKNTDYSKFFGGIKKFEFDGKNVVFNVAPGKFGLGKVKWNREVHLPMLYDETTNQYIIDYANRQIYSEAGGGYINKNSEKEEKHIEEMISDKLGIIDENALKKYGKLRECRKVDATGRNLLQYIDTNTGKIVFLAREYTEIGLDGEEVKKYRCQKTIDSIPELEGLEPKGMLNIGEIDEKQYMKQLKLFEDRAKDIEREKIERAKAEAAKAKEAEKAEKELGGKETGETEIEVEADKPIVREKEDEGLER